MNTQSNTIIDVLNYTQNNIFDEFKTFVYTQDELLLNLDVEIKDIPSSDFGEIIGRSTQSKRTCQSEKNQIISI